MAGFKLSPDQEKVVEAHDCSLLVAAAAGSGKTAVLVKRIMERLFAGKTSVDRLLIVTFTKAAAAEMKERIGKAISEAIENDPDNKELKLQYALLPNAQISTIDSFCGTVVRDDFQEAGINPGFSVMDDGEEALLRSDILDELFEEEYANNAEDFNTLIRSYGKYRKEDKGVRNMVERLFDYADHEPWPDVWLDEVEEASVTGLTDELFNGIVLRTKRACREISEMAKKALSICRTEAGPFFYEKVIQNDIDTFMNIISAEDDPDIIAQTMEIKWMSLTRPPKDALFDDKIKTEVKKIRDDYKEAFNKLKDRYYGATVNEHKEIFAKTAPVANALVRLTREFGKRLYEAKKEKNSYSFNDIEHMALNILCRYRGNNKIEPTEIADELAASYDEIMIDEYQDSSYIQEYILSSISGEFGGRIPNLFMVGDVKQSIYSFRQARPELFTTKYDEFGREGSHRKIDLSANFRSRESVLDSVNVILAPIMRPDLTEIDYNSEAALHFGSKEYTEVPSLDSPYDTELILIEGSTDKRDALAESAAAKDCGNDEKQEAIDAVTALLDPDEISDAKTTETEREALTVGLKIRELMEAHFQVSDGTDKVTGEKKTRDVRYGDFAVLTRNSKRISEVFTKVLTNMGIPAIADVGTGFFATVEVKKTLSFLRILDNPYDDIAFAAVLYSPFAGLSVSDLAEIRIFNKTADAGRKMEMLYTGARRIAASEEMSKKPVFAKLNAFFEKYDDLSRLKETLSVHELIEALYTRTGYRDIVTEQPGGERRRGNLDYLVTLAGKYEKSSYVGLHDFVRYIDRLLEKEKDYGEAGIEANSNTVNVMTVYKSKGLEFPVVFFCRTGKKFNDTEVRDSMVMSHADHLATNYVDPERRVKIKTIKQQYIQDRIEERLVAEETRVLYVALTRAKEKLFIVGTCEKVDEAVLKWRDKIMINGAFTGIDIGNAHCYLDLICPTVLGDLNFEPDSSINDICTSSVVTRYAGIEKFEARFVIGIRAYDEKTARALIGGPTETGEGEKTAEAEKTVFDDPEVAAEIKAQESFVYPNLEMAKTPMRVSVSDLKHIEIENLTGFDEKEEEYVPLLPGFLLGEEEKNGETGAMRGTLYHEVFEKMRYGGTYDTEENAARSISDDIEKLIAEGFLEKDIMDTVSVKVLTTFALSDTGKMMIKAAKEGKLYREQAFVYGLSPEEYRFYTKSDAVTEGVMVQGIIDAYIEDTDGIVLIDYKTDKVYRDAKSELSGKYRVQLDLYAKALERLTGRKVLRKVIYSVTAGFGFDI